MSKRITIQLEPDDLSSNEQKKFTSVCSKLMQDEATKLINIRLAEYLYHIHPVTVDSVRTYELSGDGVLLRACSVRIILDTLVNLLRKDAS